VVLMWSCELRRSLPRAFLLFRGVVEIFFANFDDGGRFAAVAATAAARASVLKHAVSVHEVLRDIYVEIAWSDNEEILAIVPELGQDLTSVKRLQKKHQVFGYYFIENLANIFVVYERCFWARWLHMVSVGRS
jgi:hypothetical protein